MKPIGVAPVVDIERLVSAYLAMSPDVQAKFFKLVELTARGDLVTKAALNKYKNGRLTVDQLYGVAENQHRLFEQGKATSDPNN